MQKKKKLKKIQINNPTLTSSSHDVYHFMLSLSTVQFLFGLFLVYIFINILFAIMYFVLGQSGFSGTVATNPTDFFIECFFFSVQTLSTIGYGHIAPASLSHNLLVTVEALTGMMAIAVITGLIFSRFSRPMARVVFSQPILITNFMGQRSLMFRLANARFNQVVEASLNLVMVQDAITPEGISLRQQIDLNLARSRSAIFSFSWTVRHVIDEKSPLFQLTADDVARKQIQFIVSLQGHDETFAQVIRARHVYYGKNIVWDRQFVDIVHRQGPLDGSENGGQIVVDIEKISDLN